MSRRKRAKAALPWPFPARTWQQRESFQKNLPQKRYRAYIGITTTDNPCAKLAAATRRQITICLFAGSRFVQNFVCVKSGCVQLRAQPFCGCYCSGTGSFVPSARRM